MKLIVSNPPHWHSGLSESKLNRDFIIGMVPAMIHSLYFFGMHAARVISLCVAVAVLSEILARNIFRKRCDPPHGSSVVFINVRKPSTK